MSGWAGLERIALSTAGVLTAAFGVAVLLGGTSSVPRPARHPPGVAVREPRARAVAARLGHRARRARLEPRGARLVDPRPAPEPAAPDAGARARRPGHRARHLRGGRPRRPRARAAPRAPARDRRERHVHATVGPIDRLTDVASTVQGPLSVRALAVRRARRAPARPAGADVGGLARSAGGGAPVRSGADEARGRPERFTIVFSRSPARAARRARRSSSRPAAPRCRARSAPARRAPPRSCPPSTARRRASPSPCPSAPPAPARPARS